MTQKLFARWIKNLFATQEHEIDCRQLQNHLPAFVEAEMNDAPLPHTAVLMTHLQQCPDCDEVYQGLRLVVQAESTESFPADSSELSPMSTGD